MSIIRLGRIKYPQEKVKWVHAAPMIDKVEVRNPKAKKRHAKQIRALIDTGSDVSLIPISILKSLGVKPRGKKFVFKVIYINGATKIRPFYRVSLKLCSTHDAITSKYILGWQRNYILIGRDILKKTKLQVCWGEPRTGWIEIAA